MTYYLATRLLYSGKRFQPVKVFGNQAVTVTKDYATHYDTYDDAIAVASSLSATHGIYEFKVKETK